MLYRCDHAGTLTSLSAYCITGGGYSLGTGGSVECRVETDAAGLPSGTLVATGTAVTLTTPNSSAVRTWTFVTSPVLEFGVIYHFVFSNKDASPAANYISLDNVDVAGYSLLAQPTIPDSYLFCNWQNGSPPWIAANDSYFPIFRLLYADGAKRGPCTYESGGPHDVGGLLKSRENFTPTVSMTVSGVFVCIAKRAGTTADLVINLRNLTASTLLETANVTAASVNTATDITRVYGARYVGFRPATPVALSSGTNYAVEVTSTETANRYALNSSRHGGVPASFGALLDADDRYVDGVYQYSSDGSTFTSVDTGQSHLEFYLERAS